jgi:hypothetical protein
VRRDGNEIIEVFDPDAFEWEHDFDAAEFEPTGSDSTGFGGEAGTNGRTSTLPRWIAPAGLAALAGVVVVSVTGGSSTPDAARPETTTVPAASSQVTLAPLPATVEAQGTGVDVAPRYAVVTPPGYVVVQTSDDVTMYGPDYSSQLWATPGSTASSGQWISIAAFDNGRVDPALADSFWWPNSYRLAIGDLTATVSAPNSSHGTTNATMVVGPMVISVDALGVAPSSWPEILGSISQGTTDGGRIDIEPAVLAGHALIVDTPRVWRDVQGDGPRSQFVAVSRNGGARRGVLIVSTSRSLPAASQVADVLPFILESMRIFRAPDGSLGVAGRDPQYGGAMAYWVDPEGSSVEVRFSGTVDQVIALAQSAYQTSAEEWSELADINPELRWLDELAAEASAQVDELRIDDERTMRTSLWQATTGDGVRYSWRITSATDNNEFAMDEFDGQVATIQTASTIRSTTVLATMPSDLGEAVLTIYPTGGEPVLRQLRAVDLSFGVLAATALVEQVGPFTATITSPDGTLLAVWPPAPEP